MKLGLLFRRERGGAERLQLCQEGAETYMPVPHADIGSTWPAVGSHVLLLRGGRQGRTQCGTCATLNTASAGAHMFAISHQLRPLRAPKAFSCRCELSKRICMEPAVSVWNKRPEQSYLSGGCRSACPRRGTPWAPFHVGPTWGPCDPMSLPRGGHVGHHLLRLGQDVVTGRPPTHSMPAAPTPRPVWATWTGTDVSATTHPCQRHAAPLNTSHGAHFNAT